MKLAVVALLASGCVVVPKATRSVSTVPAGVSESKGELGKLSVDIAANDDHVTVEIGRKRTCFRKHLVDVHTTIGKTGDLKVGDLGRVNHPRALVGITVLAPFALLASGVITGIVVAASKNETTVERTVENVERFDCSVRQSEHARVELPSGATLELASDARGHADFRIPTTEPDVGHVLVTSGEATSTMRYFRSPAACVATREQELLLVGRRDPQARRRQIERLPICRSANERVWKLTRKAMLAAIDGRCDLAMSAGAKVYQLDRVHHDSLLVTQPDVAACFGHRVRRTESWADYVRAQRRAAWKSNELDTTRAPD